jgi:hypothetical protein
MLAKPFGSPDERSDIRDESRSSVRPASSLRSCGLLAQAFASRVAKAVERTANVRGVEDHEDFGKYGFTVGAGWAYPQE